ncbi:InlB B-repeat-containing protein [Collinsella bouchesdurhonensis]|uniref:InlB B-repeat-containing protein n=1 Tax=Collinsella bouchesdurhonensis TaxID=1907654 RepID=UPI0015F2E9BD|nr:InlB B-repeat-containing protein [Collinsella bouchesdurhonensis]
MVLPTAAFAAGAGTASGVSSSPAELTQPEGTESAIAEVNGKSYPSLQEAINAAPRKATVKLLADTKENVTISTPYVTLDLNGHTLNGSTGERKPALTVTDHVTVMDSSETKTGTIMREDTAENSGVSSHYVIDIQGKGWLTFESGNVTNGSGAGGTKGASLVRVGDDSVAKYPGLNIKGGTFTQDNFIVIKVDSGDLFLNGGTLNSTHSYAIEDWHRASIKGGTVNGAVAAWTYGGGHNSDLTISGGTVNGNVESVTYDGAEGKTAKVSITGGTVNGTLNTVDYSTGTTSNDPTKATIEVTSGTFSTDPSRYLIEGSAATPNGNGTFGVAKAYLAQVGENSYYTMDEAFKAQTASGEAITLLRDYTTGGTFNSGSVARVVDLNGHTWTCTGTDANSAAFEINYPNASLTVKNGKIVSSQLIGLIPSAKGGTITYDNSTLTFDGVEASTTATSGIETNGNNTNDTVVLKNSTLNVPNGFGIYFPSSGTLTIDNSTINAKTMGVQVCSGSLNINTGSAITVSGDPVAKTENDGAIQDGAAISIVNRPGYKGLDKVTITGGIFTAKGDNAAIKAYTWNSSTKKESDFDDADNAVTVSGGEFNGSLKLGNIKVSGGKYTDKEVAKHLKSGFAVLFSDGKYAVDNEKAVKGDATYSVTNTDGTVVYFTDAQSANDYAKESGAPAPKVLKVTVTFDSNQGTAVDSQLVTVGDMVAKPADPTREGYIFSGWFTDQDCTKAYKFDAPVDGAQPEFTLYAGWKAATQPGTGENEGNGGGSSANANTSASTANNNSHNKGKKPAKGGLPKTGDSLTLVGSACALVAAIAALLAASVLRRKKMN